MQTSFLGMFALMVALLLPVCATGNEHDMNLDDLSMEELDAAIDAELGADDLMQYGIDIDEAYSLKELHAAFLQAFSDEGDDDDEQVITEADLQDEMKEAGTSLAKVIWDSLQRADQIASGRPASFYLRVVRDTLARRDGLTIGGVGATQTKAEVRATITRVKK